MNRTDLVNSIAKETGLSKQKCDEAVKALLKVVTNTLVNGEKFTLTGFGTFKTIKREARKGRNPKTGESIDIPSKNVARFKAGSELTKNVN